jgi:hypothetical protein
LTARFGEIEQARLNCAARARRLRDDDENPFAVDLLLIIVDDPAVFANHTVDDHTPKGNRLHAADCFHILRTAAERRADDRD